MSEIDLTTEITAFLRQRPLLRQSLGARWVIFVGDVCKGDFSRFEEAADFALTHFASERFLIRHTDAPEPQIPMFVVQN